MRAALRDGDELIVVDSASRNPAAVEEAARGVADRVLRQERPGVGSARNAGWRAASHGIVLFTDDDVVVDEGWVAALVAAVEAHPGAGFVTGRIEAPPDLPFPRREVALKRDPDVQVFDRTSVVNLGHSASMAARREALEAVGGFDEALGAGGHFRSAPEVDLFDRLLAAGWSGRYEPSALAYHEQWRDDEQIVQLDYGYGIGNGARLAKLFRADRPRARLVARQAFWSWGIAAAIAERRRGARLLAKATMFRVAGTTVGLVRGLLTPVRDGHYKPRGKG